MKVLVRDPVDFLGAKRIPRGKVALGASYAYGFDAHACRTYVVPINAGLVRLYVVKRRSTEQLPIQPITPLSHLYGNVSEF